MLKNGLTNLKTNKIMENIHLLQENIYITNDEEVKEGDWLLIIDDFETYAHKHKGDNLPTTYHKKIILTTDQKLQKDGVQAMHNIFPIKELQERLEYLKNNPLKLGKIPSLTQCIVEFIQTEKGKQCIMDYIIEQYDFAIEFENWIRVCKLKQRPYDFEDIEKLLEIYKEEIRL